MHLKKNSSIVGRSVIFLKAIFEENYSQMCRCRGHKTIDFNLTKEITIYKAIKA